MRRSLLFYVARRGPGGGIVVEPIVWVSPHLTVEPRSGGDLRTHHLLKALAGNAHTSVFVVGPPVDEARLREALGVAEVHCRSAPSSLSSRITATRRRWPLAATRAWNAEVNLLVRGRVEQGARLVCDHLYTAPYGEGLPHVLQLQNAEAARLAELPWPRRSRELANRAWDRLVLSRWESTVINRPGASVVTVSQQDADRLAVKATIVPNGAVLRPPRLAPPGGSLLFVGTLDYEPNRQALLWWAREVWPYLPAGTPPLTVVGRWGAASRAPLDRLPGLLLLGEVADLAPALQAAALVVVPLLHGSGTRLKVLEAMAWSIPVLGTSKAVEGLGLMPGVDVAVADSGSEFGALLTALLADPDRRDALGAAGRRAVESFEWNAMAAKLLQVIEGLPSGNDL